MDGLTLNNLLRSDRPESITRVMAFLIILSVIGWEWWAVIHKTEVPNLTEILLFVAVAMGWKQFTEKGASNEPTPVAPAATPTGS